MQSTIVPILENVWRHFHDRRHGRRLGAEFGGKRKNFADQIFNDLFRKKSILRPKISDDLFLVISSTFLFSTGLKSDI